MKKLLTLLAIIIVALAAGYVGAGMQSKTTDIKETAYERVVRTNILRCGYIIWPILFEKNVNTGAYSGVIYDYMDAISKVTGLKIEYVEEIPFSGIGESLRTDRIDAVCGPLWPDAARGKYVAFVNPMFVHEIFPVVRANDTRFDNNLSLINDPAVKITRIDGEASKNTIDNMYPKAGLLALPQTTDEAQWMLSLATGKADVAFAFESIVNRFNEHNETKLRIIPKTVVTYPNSIGVGVHEQSLKSWLDMATNDVIRSGMMHSILQKYGKDTADYREIKLD
jgi:ABC-type amino acid transport substrate-binding protein